MVTEDNTTPPSLTIEWRRTKGPLYSKRELKAFENYVQKLGFTHEADDDVLGFRSYMRAKDGASVLVYLDEIGDEGKKNSGTVLISMNGESRLTSVWDFLKETRWKRMGLAVQSAGDAISGGFTQAASGVTHAAKSIFSFKKGPKLP